MVERKGNSESDRIVLVVVLSLFSIMALVLLVINALLLFRSDNGLSDDNLAKECLEVNEGSVEGCLNDKSFEYFMEGDCVGALKVYDDIQDWFDQWTLAHLYDEAYSTSLSCDDESLQNYWKEKLEKVNNQLEATT